jgi:hypothetical protein
MPEVLKSSRSCFRGGLFYLVFFSAMLVGSVAGTCLAHDYPPERRAFDVVLFGLVWSFAVAGSGAYLLALSRESVSLRDGEVRFTHLLGERVLSIAAVTRARWSRRPPRLCLTWPGGRETVPLEWFRPEYRQRLIRYFREQLPAGVQEGWGDPMEGYDPLTEAKKSAEMVEGLFRW